MKTIQCDKWANYDDILEGLISENARHQVNDTTVEEKVLFRGQSHSIWNPRTTLERKTTGEWSVVECARHVYSCIDPVESLTGKDWCMPSLDENIEAVTQGREGLFPELLRSEFWMYLRHHGYPSPLLDWTQSRYIAAFFAFQEKILGSKVSVFVYIGYPTGGKGWSDRDAFITTYKHELNAHPRHMAQKSQYTIATIKVGNVLMFCPHLDVFRKEREDQDLLFKIELPSGLKEEALTDLKDRGIDWRNLIQPEEVLVEQLAERVIEGRSL